MAKFPPWWNSSATAKYSEIEMPNINPAPVPAQAQAIADEQAQQVAAVQNGMDITEIGSVLGLIIPLLFLFVLFLTFSGSGSGPAYRGSAFRDGSANLRDDAVDGLQDARPIEWSGAPDSAADNYASKVQEQQGWLTLIAAADQQMADTLDTQAAQVEWGRRELEAVIAALLGGIAVAQVMEVHWKAAIGTPAAPALAAALFAFVKVLVGVTAAAALGTLFYQVDAGERNAKRFTAARDQYQAVARGAAASMSVDAPAAGAVLIDLETAADSDSDGGGQAIVTPAKFVSGYETIRRVSDSVA